ncbi:MAG: DUF167 domain-containing protein [Candidatus Doudnabacteria bacterium]|nr:DUF167 domain-containing protein [Candidatus Doudnabacteria bacterium]
MSRIIRVKVHTHAHDENVEEVALDEYEVWVTAIPSEGAANEAVIELLADFFGIAPSKIRIRSGAKSRHKLIEIE